MSLSILLLVALFAFVSEYIDSSLGMGYGTTLTPLLLLVGFEPLEVVPAVLLSEFVTGLAGAGLHHTFGNVHFSRRSPDLKTAAVLGLCGLAGAIAAVLVAIELPPRVTGTYIGVMVLGTGVVILATRRHALRFSWPRIVGLGLVAAFNKGIGGGGYGTLITAGQILSGLDAKAAIGVSSLAQGLVSFIGVTAYILLIGSIKWQLGLALLGGALLSTPLAVLTIRRIPHPLLRMVVGLAACLLGALTLLQFNRG